MPIVLELWNRPIRETSQRELRTQRTIWTIRIEIIESSRTYPFAQRSFCMGYSASWTRCSDRFRLRAHTSTKISSSSAPFFCSTQGIVHRCAGSCEGHRNLHVRWNNRMLGSFAGWAVHSVFLNLYFEPATYKHGACQKRFQCSETSCKRDELQF